MKKNISHKQKGFTLIETLVALFILTLSITGPVYIASVAFRNTIDSRDNITLQYLAEEVVEVIRNKRDKKLFVQNELSNWTLHVDKCIPTNPCYMENESNEYTFTNCGNGCPNISFDPDSTSTVYGVKDVTNKSKFIREFYIENESSSGSSEIVGIKLVVNIRWSDKGRDKIYSLTERLYKIDYNQFFYPDKI